MRVFISQPMSGKTKDEILSRRNEIINLIKKTYLNSNIEFIDSVIDKDTDPTDNEVLHTPVWYLGESIKRLSTATMAYFDKDWIKARGCQIEYAICKSYGIPVKSWREFDKE